MIVEKYCVSMKISVVLPVYQVEGGIERCLRSILAQRFGDFELILVDDCGTDANLREDCMAEVRTLLSASMQKALRPEGMEEVTVRWLRHAHARGSAASRNSGVKLAEGDYILFVDSREELLPEALQRLYDCAERTSAALVVGRYESSEAFSVPGSKHRPSECRWVGHKEVLHAYLSGRTYMQACNILLRRSFVEKHHLSFVEGLLHEEIPWSFAAAAYASSMAMVSVPTCRHRESDCGEQTAQDFTSEYEAYSVILAEIAQTAFRSNVYKDRVFREWFEQQKAIFFERTMQSGDKQQLRRLYGIICGLLPLRKSTKTMIHYRMPSVIGYAVYMRMHKLLLPQS